MSADSRTEVRVQRVAISIFDDIGNPHYGGGGPVVVHQVAKRLAKEYEVTVYSGSYRGSRNQVRDGVRYVFLPVAWAGPRLGQLVFHMLLPVVALRTRPDLWIDSFTPPFSAGLVPLVSRGPVIGLVQMLGAADMARKYKLPFPLVERRGLALYKRFVVLNETDRATVQRYSRRASCVVIPNGTVRPDISDSELGRGDYILFLGRIDVRQKGLDLLLAAIANEPPALPLVIAGSGPWLEQKLLRELAKPVQRQVRLVGRVMGRQKDELIRNCALMVVPSRFETFPLSALEAMAYAKPVVCFDLPQLDWVTDDCAIRVPAFDVAGLGRAVRELAASSARRAALGRRAYELSSRYDWEVIGERYRALVAAVLDDGPGSAGRRFPGWRGSVRRGTSPPACGTRG